jgi:hypothetical protein
VGARHAFSIVPVRDVVMSFEDTSRDFPPRQTAVSFSIDQVLAAATQTATQ